jgi:hypothetical protein
LKPENNLSYAAEGTDKALYFYERACTQDCKSKKPVGPKSQWKKCQPWLGNYKIQVPRAPGDFMDFANGG